MKKLLSLLAIVLPFTFVFAQAPRMISYQGIIAEQSGNLIADGNHTLTIKLYEQPSGGEAIYEESQNVVVTKGVFTTILGMISPFPDSLRFDREYFLGVAVDGGNELLPRTAMTAAPYAMYALQSGIADALAPGAEVVTNLNGGIGPLTLKGSGGTSINRTGDTITITSAEPSGATGIQGLQNTDGSIQISNANGPVATLSVSPSAVPWATSGSNISSTNSGNVGIGTTTPATKLEVNGTTRTRDLQITAGAASGRMLVGNASGTAVWTTDMKIVGGNVGIGDTTPKAKLHVRAGDSGFDPTFVRSMVLEEDGHLTLSLRGPTNMEQSILFERPVGDTGMRISSQPDGDMRIGRYRFTDNGSASSSFHLFLDVQTGNFGIKRDPVTNDLEVDGTASKLTAGDWLANSDRRIKTDIRDIDGSFATLLKLRPVKFRYNEEWLKRNPSIEDREYYNFIAQEYQQVFPDAVQGSGEYLKGDPNEILQVDTYNAQVVTIKAVQELIHENAALKTQLSTIEAKLRQLEERIASETAVK